MGISVKNTLLCMAAAMMTLAATLAPASAASPAIERAKDNCEIGEQADGYLGVVTGKSINASLRREMNDINQQRKAVYADLANRNGVTVEDTAKLTARKLQGQATSGQCVRAESGAWRKI